MKPHHQQNTKANGRCTFLLLSAADKLITYYFSSIIYSLASYPSILLVHRTPAALNGWFTKPLRSASTKLRYSSYHLTLIFQFHEI